MHFLLSLIFNLDFKPLFVLIEASSGSVYNIQYAPTHEDRDLLSPICCLCSQNWFNATDKFMAVNLSTSSLKTFEKVIT